MSARLTQLFLALCLGVGVLSGVACKKAEKPPKTEFILFDLSASTASRKIRARYVEDFEKLLANIHGGDTLVVDRITSNPLAQSTFPVNETFKEMNPWLENPLKWRRESKGQREQAQQTVEKMVLDLKQRYSKTSIIDALHLAQRVFATYPDGRHVLVIFSDMVEESSYYDFRKESLKAARIQEILETEKAEKRLPELDKVEVHVVGALAGYYSTRLQPAAVRDIQNFWLEYFKACGANLSAETYGSGLIQAPD